MVGFGSRGNSRAGTAVEELQPMAKCILEQRKCLVRKEQQLKRKTGLQKNLSIMDLLLIPASLPTRCYKSRGVEARTLRGDD